MQNICSEMSMSVQIYHNYAKHAMMKVKKYGRSGARNKSFITKNICEHFY